MTFPAWPSEAVGDQPEKPKPVTVWLRRLVPILMTGCTLAGLAFWGAGIFPGTPFFVAAVLSATAAGYALILPRPHLFPARPWVEWALLLMVGGMMVTLLPLPPAGVALFKGPRGAFWEPVRNLFAAIEATALKPAVQTHYWPALSLNRPGTLRGVMLFIACAMSAWLSASIEPRLKKGFVRFLLILGVGVAVAGFHSQWTFPQGDRLWWIFPVPPALPGPVGGFLNRNHFAGFVALFCPVAFGLTVTALRDRKFWPALAGLLVLLVLTAVVFSSLSRGAMLAAGAGLAGVAVLFGFGRTRKPVLGLALCLLCGGIGLIAFCHPVRERLAGWKTPVHLPSAQSRLSQWRDGLKILPDYALEGVGVNALGVVYPQYRTTVSSGTLRYAENDYVQFLVETGAVGLTLTVFLGWALYRRRVLLRRSEATDADLDRIIWGVVVVVAVHAVFDFPLRIPVYALTVATLVGLLFRPLPVRWPGSFLGRLEPGPSLALFPLICCLILIGLHPYQRAAHLLDRSSYLQRAPVQERLRAIAWSPANAQAWFFLGWQIGALDPKVYPAEYRVGEQCVARAAELDPNNYRIWRHLTAMREALGDTAGADEAWQKARTLRPWISLPGRGAKTP